jgi:uncharacterized YigZ family protein
MMIFSVIGEGGSVDSQSKLKYLSIQEPAGPEEIKRKGSRFLGFSYPVSDNAGANDILVDLRKKYHDATHICTACRFHDPEQELIRYDDNGEPGGTAGLPIYYEIRRKHYYNILVVVIRYFGGIKLGTSGLAKAYGATARQVLDMSKQVTCFVRTRAGIFIPFDFIGELRWLMEQFSVQLIKEDYQVEGIHVEISVPLVNMEKMKHLLRERSKGTIQLEETS